MKLRLSPSGPFIDALVLMFSEHAENAADINVAAAPGESLLAQTALVDIPDGNRIQVFARVFTVNAGNAGTLNVAVRAVPAVGPEEPIDATEDGLAAGNDRTTTLAGVQQSVKAGAWQFKLVANFVGAGATPLVLGPPPSALVAGAQLLINIYQ